MYEVKNGVFYGLGIFWKNKKSITLEDEAYSKVDEGFEQFALDNIDESSDEEFVRKRTSGEVVPYKSPIRFYLEDIRTWFVAQIYEYTEITDKYGITYRIDINLKDFDKIMDEFLSNK
jgi:hypothetical protein